MKRALWLFPLLVLAGCGGSNEISPAAGVPDSIDFGDHVSTLDGDYAAGTTPIVTSTGEK